MTQVGTDNTAAPSKQDEAVTEAMYEAGYAAWQEQDTNGVQLWRADFAAIYTAMRRAAPDYGEDERG